jgi:ribonuclease P protein component
MGVCLNEGQARDKRGGASASLTGGVGLRIGSPLIPLPSLAAEGGILPDPVLEEHSDEAHISAQQPRPRPSPRVPHPQRDAGWPQHPARPPRPWPQEAFGLTQSGPDAPDALTVMECVAEGGPAAAIRIESLRKRSDFLAANRGIRVARPGFVLLVNPVGTPAGMRFGVTVTKKIGNAVVRNRMKRRFRALLREMLPQAGIAGADHVVIGREGGVERDFALLRTELAAALTRAAAGKGDPPRKRPGKGAPRK